MPGLYYCVLCQEHLFLFDPANASNDYEGSHMLSSDPVYYLNLEFSRVKLLSLPQSIFLKQHQIQEQQILYQMHNGIKGGGGGPPIGLSHTNLIVYSNNLLNPKGKHVPGPSTK
jgi:hypothetical protein